MTLVLALAACAGFVRLRRISKRLERLSESYWELRYEYGQVNAKLDRLAGTRDEATTQDGALRGDGQLRAAVVLEE